MDLRGIEALFATTLTSGELRRLVEGLPGGDELATSLPGPAVPHAELAHEAVALLRRQRRLDDALLLAYAHAVPARAAELRGLLEGAGGSAPATTDRAEDRRPVEVRQEEVTGGVGVAVRSEFGRDVRIQQGVIRGGKGVVLGDD